MAQVKADPKAAAARRADGQHITQRTVRTNMAQELMQKQAQQWRKDHIAGKNLQSRKEMLS